LRPIHRWVRQRLLMFLKPNPIAHVDIAAAERASGRAAIVVDIVTAVGAVKPLTSQASESFDRREHRE